MLRSHLEIDVDRDAFLGDAVEVGLKFWFDDAIGGNPVFHKVVVAVALCLENVAGEFAAGFHHLLQVDGIGAVGLTRKSTFLQEEAEGEHIGFAMRACCTKTHRAEDAGHKGDVVVHDVGVSKLTHFVEFGHQEKTEDVGLGFFEG